MSYNIKGLPWPITSGRADAIAEMGQRLASMRASDAQPHIVLLQEAFGDDASTLSRAAGYRYLLTGPQASHPAKAPPLGQSFADDASWIKGEESGSLTDSGLAILSDYPVARFDRYAFPQGACAGYDCFAAKGVVVAWIAIPDAGEPVAFVDTHLNSRHATHVTGVRADMAYAWQVSAVRQYLARVLSPGTPVIFGGDFNIGEAPARVAIMAESLIAGTQIDSLRAAVDDNLVFSGDQSEAGQLLARNKDKILARNGARVRLRTERAWVPFPLNAQQALSDHAGFVIEYSLKR